MTVDSTHPDYNANLPAWSRTRDVLAGEDAVKAAGEKYLPRLDSHNDEEYAAYRARASFFGATARTQYLDLVSRPSSRRRVSVFYFQLFAFLRSAVVKFFFQEKLRSFAIVRPSFAIPFG